MRIRYLLLCVVFSALEFSCLFFFLLKKKRKAAATANESTEAEMEDTGSPEKKKPTSSSKSKECSHSHGYWCGRLTLAKGQTPTQPLIPLLSWTKGENRMRKCMG